MKQVGVCAVDLRVGDGDTRWAWIPRRDIVSPRLRPDPGRTESNVAVVGAGIPCCVRVLFVMHRYRVQYVQRLFMPIYCRAGRVIQNGPNLYNPDAHSDSRTRRRVDAWWCG